MKARLAMMLAAALLLSGCGGSGGSGSKGSAEPYVIRAGGTSVSLLESRSEIENKLGDKISFDYNVSDKTIVRGGAEGAFTGLDGSDYGYSYYSPAKDNAGKFTLYNGINGKSSEEDIKKALGDGCMSISEGGQTVYYEAFVNGSEIDYSSVAIKELDENGSDTVNMSMSIRASCEELVDSGGNYILISYECTASRVNLTVNVFKKGMS